MRVFFILIFLIGSIFSDTNNTAVSYNNILKYKEIKKKHIENYLQDLYDDEIASSGFTKTILSTNLLLNAVNNFCSIDLSDDKQTLLTSHSALLSRYSMTSILYYSEFAYEDMINIGYTYKFNKELFPSYEESLDMEKLPFQYIKVKYKHQNFLFSILNIFLNWFGLDNPLSLEDYEFTEEVLNQTEAENLGWHSDIDGNNYIEIAEKNNIHYNFPYACSKRFFTQYSKVSSYGGCFLMEPSVSDAKIKGYLQGGLIGANSIDEKIQFFETNSMSISLANFMKILQEIPYLFMNTIIDELLFLLNIQDFVFLLFYLSAIILIIQVMTKYLFFKEEIEFMSFIKYFSLLILYKFLYLDYLGKDFVHSLYSFFQEILLSICSYTFNNLLGINIGSTSNLTFEEFKQNCLQNIFDLFALGISSYYIVVLMIFLVLVLLYFFGRYEFTNIATILNILVYIPLKIFLGLIFLLVIDYYFSLFFLGMSIFLIGILGIVIVLDNINYFENILKRWSVLLFENLLLFCIYSFIYGIIIILLKLLNDNILFAIFATNNYYVDCSDSFAELFKALMIWTAVVPLLYDVICDHAEEVGVDMNNVLNDIIISMLDFIFSIGLCLLVLYMTYYLIYQIFFVYDESLRRFISETVNKYL